MYLALGIAAKRAPVRQSVDKIGGNRRGGLRFRVQGLGFRVEDFGLGVQSAGCRV